MAFSSRLTLLCDHEYRLRTYVVVVSEYVGVRYAATMWRKIARQKERERGGGGLQQETERERERPVGLLNTVSVVDTSFKRAARTIGGGSQGRTYTIPLYRRLGHIVQGERECALQVDG